MIFSCKEAAKIISSGKKLSVVKKLKLSVHLFLCKHCSGYSMEMSALKSSASQNIKEKLEASQETIKRVEKEVLDRHTGSNL